MKSQVSAKGQITIPKPLRDSLGFGPGTKLAFEERDGELVAHRANDENVWEKVRGILPPGDVDAIMREMRGPDWDPALDPESLDPVK